MQRPRIVVAASGTKDCGGTGFENLVLHSRGKRGGELDASIVGVFSNHARGGVRRFADRLGVPFIHYEEPFDPEFTQTIVRGLHADFVVFSGWLKLLTGLDPRTTINIHPGPLPRDPELRARFGGKGLYGERVSTAALSAWYQGMIPYTAVTMHFVTEKYDDGPAFFEYPVGIFEGDTAETLHARVHEMELIWQPIVTNMVVHGEIRWDGRNTSSLVLPRSCNYPPLL